MKKIQQTCRKKKITMVSEEKPSLTLISFLLKRGVEVLLLASRSLSPLFKGHVFKKALNWRILSLWDQKPSTELLWRPQVCALAGRS